MRLAERRQRPGGLAGAQHRGTLLQNIDHEALHEEGKPRPGLCKGTATCGPPCSGHSTRGSGHANKFEIGRCPGAAKFSLPRDLDQAVPPRTLDKAT